MVLFYLSLEGTTKNFLKVLIPVLFLVLLAACAAQPSEPTPTVTPQLPEQAEIIAAYLKALSEKRTEEALSYLADEVRLDLGGICFSGKYARAIIKDWLESPGQFERIGENYRVDGDIVHLDYKEFSSDGSLVEERSMSYSVSDGLIQWQTPCQP